MMAAWLVRRMIASLAIIFAVVTLVFFLIHLAPGEPFTGQGGDSIQNPAVRDELRRQFGLDQPILVQYGRYLVQLARGNLGYSLAQRRPVSEALGETIPLTLQLTGVALVIDLLVGLLIGVYQSLRVNRFPDVAFSSVTLFVYSLPTFWLGLMLLLVFAQKLGWFPAGGASDPVLCPVVDSFYCVLDRMWHLTLPALTLGLVGAAGTARYQRAAMLEVARQDYIRTARAKGLPERQVVLKHQLRNALLSFITRVGLALPFLLTGAVLTETIFAWPGMGRLATGAIFNRDYPVVTAVALVAGTLVVAGNLLADILLGAADPRTRVRDAARSGAASA